jgi:cytochrome c oxidase cbb3-type subunit III
MNSIFSLACCLMLLGISWAAQAPPEKEIPEKNPFDSAADAAAGRQYFMGHCALCHGPEGEGGRGINLTTGRYRMGGSDRELFRTIQKGIPESEMPGTGLSENEIWRIVAFVRRLATAGAEEKAPGDPAAGKLVYEGKGMCAPCHVVGDGGGRLGPELSEVGLRRSLKFLRESLDNPAAYIADNYRTVTVLTSTGEPVTGIKLNEDDYSIQVRDIRDNLRSFLKSDLKEVKRESRSLMPAYGSTLSAVEIENVVAYLSSLRGKK